MTRALASSRVATLVALAVAVVAGAGALVFDVLVLPAHPQPPLSSGWAGVLPGAALLVAGSLLLWRLAWHPIAVVLTAFGVLWVVDGLASAAVNYAWYFDRAAAWALPAFWFFTRFGSVLLLPITLLLLLFPDGRLRPRGWRIVSIVSIALSLVMPFAFLFAPARALAADDPDRDPLMAVYERDIGVLPLPDGVWSVLLQVGAPCMALSLLLALVVCVSRRFGASADERAQLRWLVWSGIVFVASLVGMPYVPTFLVDVMLTLAIGLVCASVVLAVTRHRLYAIDRVLPWTLAYGLLLVGVLAVDIVLVLALGSAIDDRVALVAAMIVVTAVYAPLRDRVFAFFSRLVSGRRGDPYAVVSSLGDRLDGSADTRTQLGELAAAVAEAFASPYVRVELDRAESAPLMAERGTPGVAPVTVPIDSGGVVIGRILLEPGRRPVVSRRDQRLLGDLVRLAAASLRGAELSRELQAIRERLVLAREEERSRLRRELHDGLGPVLGGVKLRLETARNLAEKAPERSVALLDAAIADSSEAIDEIRRIVHDLRPPALDDLGLLGALRQQAARLSGGGLVATVTGNPPAALPPAVEVAAYRIASEALANARRHSEASVVTVELRADGPELELIVRDDGTGIPDDAAGGVGLRSLRERAAELGGTVVIERPGETGTVVRALLPLVPAGSDSSARAIQEEASAHVR
ncbi:sensor histidine kinase [Microbacterium sp. RD1]|uniref:sensor histidine kinase n=1 Tax=Microbacterium sp. RD1 TaxID=3457313 RepID=UPI003FA5D315